MFVLGVAVFHDVCTILNQSIQVHRSTDRQGNDADGKRDSQFDAHEDEHGQATANANHVVQKAGEDGESAEESRHGIAVEDTPIRYVVEYQVEMIAYNKEYRVNHQSGECLAEGTCLVVVAEYQGKDASHSLENRHVHCCHHSRKYFV